MRTGLAPTLTGSSLFSFQGTGAVQRRIPSLSQATLEVKSFFFGAARRRAPVRKRSRIFSGFARWKDRARASPGEGKIRKLPRHVKRKASAKPKKARRRSDGPLPRGTTPGEDRTGPSAPTELEETGGGRWCTIRRAAWRAMADVPLVSKYPWVRKVPGRADRSLVRLARAIPFRSVL